MRLSLSSSFSNERDSRLREAAILLDKEFYDDAVEVLRPIRNDSAFSRTFWRKACNGCWNWLEMDNDKNVSERNGVNSIGTVIWRGIGRWEMVKVRLKLIAMRERKFNYKWKKDLWFEFTTKCYDKC